MNRETILSQENLPVNTPSEYAHYKRIRDDMLYRLELRMQELEDRMLPSFYPEELELILSKPTKKVFLTPKEYDEFNQVRAEVTYLRGKVMELSKDEEIPVGGKKGFIKPF